MPIGWEETRRGNYNAMEERTSTCLGRHLPRHLAPSHLQLAVREAGAVADQAERKKKDKYAELAATHHFVPVAIETMGVFGKEAEAFFIELGRRIREETGEPLSFHYLLQRIAVAVQRGNAAAVLGTTPPSNSDPIFTS